MLRLYRRMPPFALALVAMVMAMGTMGVSYTLWADRLDVNGVVHTGKVDTKWTGNFCTEFWGWPNLPGAVDANGNPISGTGEFEGKDVGSTTFTGLNTDILTITVKNGYPSYAVDCEVEFTNTGTIPVKVRGENILAASTNLTSSGGTQPCVATGQNTGNVSLKCDQLTVQLINGIGSQIDPLGGPLTPYTAASSLRFHVEQQANEQDTYQFQVQFCTAQWNEDATAAQCFTSPHTDQAQDIADYGYSAD